ncbi:MAG: site-specific integrase [Rhodospirillaceae bacterium]|nr:site-specific integrase [Rhodospirillaceae bacterium]
MSGKQAKFLAPQDIRLVLRRLRRHRHRDRDLCIFLLSLKAGLRAAEIAGLTYPMILAADGSLGGTIELHDAVAKKRSGRIIPIHASLRAALLRLMRKSDCKGPVIRSERGEGPMTAKSVVNWFAALYRDLGLQGASSHSGRRTFITLAARRLHLVGASLRDVQQLAGHASLNMTARYIQGDSPAQRRLVQAL